MDTSISRREQLLRVLQGSARSWSVRELSRNTGIRPRIRVQEILLELQRQGQVCLVEGTRWRAKGPIRPPPKPAIPSDLRTDGTQTERSGPGQGDGSTNEGFTGPRGSQPQVTGRFAGSRWADFRRLCLYYADCVRLEQGTSAKSYADRENESFISLGGRYDWRGICAGASFLVEANEHRSHFFRRVSGGGTTTRLLLGSPVDVHCGKDRKTGELYTIISPLFVLGVSHQLDGGDLVLAADGRVGVNQRRWSRS